jgi:hypothetical protein
MRGEEDRLCPDKNRGLRAWCLSVALPLALAAGWSAKVFAEETRVMDRQQIKGYLHDHLAAMTRTIGERSVRRPDNLEKAASYIQAHFTLDFDFMVELVVNLSEFFHSQPP